MGTVVEIRPKGSHVPATINGAVHCMSCGFEWTAVSPAGTVWLECPACRTMKGLYRFPCLREEEAHWICGCGNDLFHATPEGFYCPNCGAWQYGF